MKPYTNGRFIQAACLFILAGLTTACASHMTPINPFAGKAMVIPADAEVTEQPGSSQPSVVTRTKDSRVVYKVQNVGSTVHGIDLNVATPKAIPVSSRPESPQFQRLGGAAWLLPGERGGSPLTEVVGDDRAPQYFNELNTLDLGAGVQMAQATPGATEVKKEASQKPDLELLSKKAANPLSDLWLLWSQNDTSFLQGDLLPEDKILNSYKFQPIMPVPMFGGAWNFLIRPIIQVQSVPLDSDASKLFGVNGETIIEDTKLSNIAGDPFGRTTGLGDSVLLTLVGPNRIDGFIWGVGASQIFPTATKDVLGQQKWQAGPAVLLARMGKKPGDFNLGLLPQHWWSYAGDDDRKKTSLTDIQYFINYKANTTALIGMAPNIRINWKADKSKNKFTIPIGLGYNDMAFMGKLPFRYGVEMQYSIIRPDNAGTKWNIRVYFIPIVPNLFKS